MAALPWEAVSIPSADTTLITYFHYGKGTPLLFLHGGPGDDHQVLQSLATPFVDSFHCLLLDQRGSGRSPLAEYTRETLHIHRFFADIEAVRQSLGVEKIGIIGHSWGAILGLHYAALYPDRIEKLVLIGMGPLTEEMSEVASANLLAPLSLDDRERMQEIRQQRKDAIAAQDFERQRELHIELVTQYYAKRWFFLPETRERFATFYVQHYAYNPRVGPCVMPTIKEIPLWERLPGLEAPVLIVYGYQDFEPITQAYLVKEYVPQAEPCFINACGHVPWFEQAALCFDALRRFLHRDN